MLLYLLAFCNYDLHTKASEHLRCLATTWGLLGTIGQGLRYPVCPPLSTTTRPLHMMCSPIFCSNSSHTYRKDTTSVQHPGCQLALVHWAHSRSTDMHRCNASDADLLLDTWPWRFLDLAEAVALHRTLAGYHSARWPDWPAPPSDMHAWRATRPPCQRTKAPDVLTSGQPVRFSPHARYRDHGGV